MNDDDLTLELRTVFYLLGLMDLAQQRGLIQLGNLGLTEPGRESFRRLVDSGYRMDRATIRDALANRTQGVPPISADVTDELTDILSALQEA